MGILDIFKKLASRNSDKNGADSLPLLDSLERDAKKSDIVWVQYFNIKLGLDLGGIIEVMEAFSDSATLMKHFCLLLENDMAASRRGSCTSERQNSVTRILSQFDKKEQGLLSTYWDFFGEACARICSKPKFVEWIHEPKNFTAMPDIFTYEILKLACKITGK
jgi:hypothetical protein